MSCTSDNRELLTRIRDGDPQAASDLWRRYEETVRRIARCWLRGNQLRRRIDSDDVCQEVMSRVMRRIADGTLHIGSPVQFEQLLVVISRRVSRELVKRERRVCRDVARTKSLLSDVLPAQQAPPIVDLHERHALLQRVLQSLSDEERRLINGRLAGQSWVELAEEHLATPDSLRMRFHRIMRRLIASMREKRH